MQVVLFEDSNVEKLSPITLMRPASRITCGGLQLRRLFQARGYSVLECVRPYLRAVSGMKQLTENSNLFVNARLIPSVENFSTIEKVVQAKQPRVIHAGDSMACLFIADEISCAHDDELASLLGKTIVDLDIADSDASLELFEYPHDVIRAHIQQLKSNIEFLIELGNYEQVRDGVFASAGCRIDPQSEFDTNCGPVLLEGGVKIRPFSFLRGPIFLDVNSRINEHSSITDNVYIGPHCKIGGEVEESTLEGYSNKQHFGFLGHSYVGSWVNLGAGTSNSDLKNTYGEIRMEYDGTRVPTGMQFLGSVIGDYSKTAVNTAIFTGKTIGVCSMLYGFVTQNVPSFCNYAKSFGQMTDIPPKVIVDMQRRMFARRGIEQSEDDIHLISKVYDSISAGRQLAVGPPSL